MREEIPLAREESYIEENKQAVYKMMSDARYVFSINWRAKGIVKKTNCYRTRK